ncbi:DUF2489 domain-containing protein [Motiliproteus sediminis]|uniref:DUF2489 domain-containing protein n=1 Tax=Motiliproteus sediminis TaxID=1468178 RepID=UPI001AEF7E81|nr:DUF2489 domain-containing protein [Motiliproteus sediminis]
MSESTQWLLIVVGCLAIAGLMLLIRGQLRRQQKVQQQQQQRLAEIEAEAQKQRDYLEQSVRVIATAMQEEQCEMVEGCIRLKKLLDHLAPYLHEHETFGIFNTVFEATKHMPILDEWKKLKLRQKVGYMQEMDALEKSHKQTVLAAAAELASYRFSH